MGEVQKLRTSELHYRRLFETSQDGILILDAEAGMITDVNPFLIKMLGYSRKEITERKLWEVGMFQDVDASKQAFKVLQEKGYIRYDDLPLRTKGGQVVQVEFVSNVYWVNGEKVIQCNIRDNTERKLARDALLRSEALLRELSVRDHLTGLFNRRYMEETLERELLRATRRQITVGIIILDVDGFKQFNDTYGHVAGDAILRELGSLLRSHIRGDDIPCRYGGDEFILVLPDTSFEVTRKRAELICESAKRFKPQFDDRALDAVTFSLGVAIFPENGSSGAAVLRAADTALYRAKHAGRDRVVVAG